MTFVKKLTKEEKYYFNEGTWNRSFEFFGAHLCRIDGVDGCCFCLWVPEVKSVSVTGSFNNWDTGANMMERSDDDIWSVFIPGVKENDMYKYYIDTGERCFYKADPYAFTAECPPNTASMVCDIEGYKWSDGKYISARQHSNHMEKPLNIYEVHAGSFLTHEDGSFLSYVEMADKLVNYVKDMGYTHIELLPVMEHPFAGSWGYQVTGYYAPTKRYGSPKDFMYFVDMAHKAGIGVILDWVPGHFCKDEHGLSEFNGKMVYETGTHPEWGTAMFDFEKGQVSSFLISNASFWLEKYHIDGLRVDGVTSMLYLNFGVEDEAKKRFNKYGKEENLDAVRFLQNLNDIVGVHYPDTFTIAEESTAWPLVTYPPSDGGLGFNYKWDMGWMHDTLHYMQTDFPFRPGNHNLLTFSMMYAFNENFICALSHDEVVHGKCSLIRRMPGDYWRMFAGLRSLALYQILHPGAKLNFMGYEIAEFIEWRYYESLEWFLPEKYEAHAKHREYIKALNHFFLSEKALWEINYSWEGFKWLDADNNKQMIISFIRHGKKDSDDLICLLNFSTFTYDKFKVGVPRKGTYECVFNSDDVSYGGSGFGCGNVVSSKEEKIHGQDNLIEISVPAIGGVVYKKRKRRQ
ncbi:MAG: 1,4-alpha-glucan branching protein GlgB [Lachnospiraceae bacterium]|nr:1,4-alpha-glucan branching protein GlgB [Lachnospiraceae bacterium]